MRIGTTTKRKPGKANPIIIGIIFAIVGAAIFFLFALPPLQYSYASKSWPAVPGTITRSEVDVWQRDSQTHYQPDIAYSYTINGEKYTSSKITIGDPPLDNNVTRAKRLQSEYPVGKEVSVYYDPELPESSALKPGSKSGDYMLAGFAAIFFFVGLVALFQGLKARRIAALIPLIGLMACLNSCEKDPVPPVLTTANVSEITYLMATSGGNITDDGRAEISARGICWATSQNPTTADNKTENGSGTGSFTSIITGLTPETVYYVRAYAVNSAGTAYGNEVSFTSGLLTDIDGNTYNTVTIGAQVWMKENLAVTKYNDGADIPYVTDDDTWFQTDDPGYAWYNNDEAGYGSTYGAMYNWYTVNTGKLCPDGWHVPADEEWTVLTDFLGGESIAGGKLKEASTEHWNSPNTDATNETGFTGLPGGYRSNGGQFYAIGSSGGWWSSSVKENMYVWMRRLHHDDGIVFRGAPNKNFGYSVRCIMD